MIRPLLDPLADTARYRAYRWKLLVWSVIARVIGFCTLATVILWHSERQHHALHRVTGILTWAGVAGMLVTQTIGTAYGIRARRMRGRSGSRTWLG